MTITTTLIAMYLLFKLEHGWWAFAIWLSLFIESAVNFLSATAQL